jgi:AcrR family transcriptional regulator
MRARVASRAPPVSSVFVLVPERALRYHAAHVERRCRGLCFQEPRHPQGGGAPLRRARLGRVLARPALGHQGHSHNFHCRYFPTKADLVYALLDLHLHDLLEALGHADDCALEPRARLEALAAGYLDYALGEGADSHRAFRQIEHWTTPSRRLDVRVKQRWIVALFLEALEAALPELAARPALASPLILSLFAMLNGAQHWLRPAGPLTAAAYAALAVGCMLCGAKEALCAESMAE